jgi:hypothetical protein
MLHIFHFLTCVGGWKALWQNLVGRGLVRFANVPESSGEEQYDFFFVIHKDIYK